MKRSNIVALAHLLVATSTAPCVLVIFYMGHASSSLKTAWAIVPQVAFLVQLMIGIFIHIRIKTNLDEIFIRGVVPAIVIAGALTIILPLWF